MNELISIVTSNGYHGVEVWSNGPRRWMGRLIFFDGDGIKDHTENLYDYRLTPLQVLEALAEYALAHPRNAE